MGYSTLKAALDAVVKTNGRQEITGSNLNGVMTQILQGVDLLERANPADTSGMSSKVLKGSLTFAEQVQDSNTIYEIRDAFNLSGASVTIPAGCILKFNGGSVANGTLVGTQTSVIAPMVRVFGDSLSLGGTWVGEGKPEWFGGGTLADDAPAILASIKAFPKTSLSGIYTIASEMDISNLSNKFIEGQNGCELRGVSGNDTTFFFGETCDNITLFNVNFNGNRPTTLSWVWPHKMNAAVIFGQHSTNISILNCKVKNHWYGVCTGGQFGENGVIAGCFFYNNNSDIDCYACPGLTIRGNVCVGCTENSIQVEPFALADGDIQDYNDYKTNPISVCSQIIDNIITDCVKDAIVVHSGAYNTIVSNNNIYNYGFGIYIIEKCYGTIVSDNIIKNCTADEHSSSGARPTGDNAAILIDAEGVVVRDNLIEYPETGIILKGAKNTEVCGNTIRKCNHTGIAITLDSTGMVLDGNVIEGACMSNTGWWGQCPVYISYLTINLTMHNFKIDATKGTGSNYHAILIENSGNGFLVIDNCDIINAAKPVEGSASVYVITNRKKAYGVGTTAQRPSPSVVGEGFQYFDTNLKKPIYSDGTGWVDSTGAAVS